MRAEIAERLGRAPRRVIVSDSFGRAWRLGQAEVAIGCAGLRRSTTGRGRPDAEGRELEATAIAIADEAAAAADLVRGKDGGIPAAMIRGLADHVIVDDGPGAGAPCASVAEDLFRQRASRWTFSLGPEAPPSSVRRAARRHGRECRRAQSRRAPCVAGDHFRF